MRNQNHKPRSSARETRSVSGKRAWGRRIVVDGADYMWRVNAGHVTIRAPDGKRHLTTKGGIGAHMVPDSWHDANVMVTPFDVANWIRVQVEGRSAIKRFASKSATFNTAQAPRATRPVCIPVQQDVYMVVGSGFGDYGPENWVASVYLDPQAAKDAAVRLNRKFGSEGLEYKAVSQKLGA